MKCVDPFIKAGEVYPCGRCLPCKFRSRRIWFHRVLLEASQHDYSSAITLTYDDASIPVSGSLQPEHLRNWLKRYRKRQLERFPWRRIRFIACGEYGESTQRPHYHVVCFGAPGCEGGRGGREWTCDCGCDTCVDITETWPIGVCSVEKLNRETAAYVVGYVTRKVLAGYTGTKLRPFMRMSTRPGIGAYAMHDVASTVLRYDLNFPVALGSKNPMLLGRYLRRKLSEYTDKEIPRQVTSPALQAVLDVAWEAGENPKSLLFRINEVYNSQLEQREALRRGNL